MIDVMEMKKTSLEFRRTSSNLLRTTYDVGNLYLTRFKKYIDGNDTIRILLDNKIVNSTFDYKDCFDTSTSSGWKEINAPDNETDHLKAAYDYMSYIVDNDVALESIAHNYYCSSNNRTEIIRNFVEKAFLPLINFIIDTLSTEIMLTDAQHTQPAINQHIQNNYGTANATNGNVTSTNITYGQNINDICKLISEVKSLLNDESIDEDVKEELKDDLEIIDEQIKTKKPNKTRIKKAFANIKSFLTNAKDTMKLGMQLVAITPVFIEKIGEFIKHLS